MANQYVDIPANGSPSWKRPVPNAASLPSTGNTIGDARIATDTDTIFVWTGSAWVAVATPGAAIAIDGLTGDVSASGPGVVPATVNFVGGSSAASVSTATVLVNTPQSGNKFLASPANGSSGAPAFRAIVSADIPSLDYANQSLSNLTSPTAVNQNLFPGADNTFDLGGSNTWKNLYVNAIRDTANLTGTLGQVLTANGNNTFSWADPATSGTVSSVALADGSTAPIYSISGSPVTSSGTLTFTLANQSANLIFAGPSSGSPDQPTFRSLVAGDIPALPYASSTLTDSHIFVGNASNVATDVAMSGDASLSNAGALTLANTAVTPGSYTYSSITVDSKGRITAASSGAAPTGTVTSVSVVSANGLAGSVATATTTPAITLSTTITGILQGNGTAISAATTGNLTDVGTDGIVITGGTGAVLGSGTSITQHVADTTHNGYLSSTDWNTFNSKQAAGNYITALTGDVTASGPGSAAATLATVNSNVGSFGTASSVGSFTVNGKGLITAASNTSIQIAESQVTNLVSDLAAKQSTTLTNTHILVGNGSNVATDVAMSGDATLANTGALTLANTAVTPGSYTYSSITVDSKGRITAASSGAAPTGTVTSVAMTVPAFLSVSGSPITTSGTLAVSLSGTALPIANGGTGQTTASAAFSALSPLTTKGDLLAFSTINDRLPVGTNGQVLTADSAQTLGVKWAAASSGSALSAITAATGTNSIDNVNFAQTWTWNSLTTETAFIHSSSSITSGKLLSLVSSNSSSSNTGILLNTSSTGSSNAATNINIAHAGTSSVARGIFANFSASTAAGVVIDSSISSNSSSSRAGLFANSGANAGATIEATAGNSSFTGDTILATHSGTSGVAGNFQTTGTGVRDAIQLRNTVAAANNSASSVLFSANRTTGGMTNIAQVAGMITDITNGAYKGALTFYTANNTAPAERMRIDNTGKVGIGNTPTYTLDVTSSLTTRALNVTASGVAVTAGYFNASAATGAGIGVFGTTASTNNSAFAIYGHHTGGSGQGIGVYGQTDSSDAGSSGVSAQANAGSGIFAVSSTGSAGFFQSSNSGNTSTTLIAQQAGSSTANLFAAQDSSANNLFVVTSTGATGVGVSSPNANAIMDLTSTTKAFMPPRMTTTQKNAIASPTNGMVIFDSTLGKLCVYSTTWQTVTSV